MKLPKIGSACVVYWRDTVDENSWQTVAVASGPQTDHDAVECWGRYLGQTDDGYIHIGNQSSFKGGEIDTVGFTSNIHIGAVINIKIIPPPKKTKSG